MTDIRRQRDALRTDLKRLAAAVNELNDPVSWLDPTAIWARFSDGPAETDPDRRLPLALEVYNLAGLRCRLWIASSEAMLVMDRWLASGPALRRCYYHRIEPSASYQDDGPWLRSVTRGRLSILHLFGQIQEDVLACTARIVPAGGRALGDPPSGPESPTAAHRRWG